MSELTWKKSSYSDSSGGDCVEVAATQVAVHVRDSKDIGGPMLHLERGSWCRFVGTLRHAVVEHAR
jgi:hypothetical protein